MLVAIISYILLNLYLMRIKAQNGGTVDDSSKAEAVAKVASIVSIINRVLAIWFKFLLWLFIVLFVAAIIALAISIFGIRTEAAWLLSIELWSFGSISHIIGEHGVSKVISAISVSLMVLVGLIYLAIWLLNNKKLWKKLA
jgi:hypothetical protein